MLLVLLLYKQISRIMEGKTALDWARQEGYTDIVRFIVNYQPSPKGELSILVVGLW